MRWMGLDCWPGSVVDMRWMGLDLIVRVDLLFIRLLLVTICTYSKLTKLITNAQEPAIDILYLVISQDTAITTLDLIFCRGIFSSNCCRSSCCSVRVCISAP